MAIMRDIMRGIMRDIMRGVMDGIGGIARIFFAPLTNSLIPTTAVDKTYTFTRNDTDATVTDFEGLVKNVTANEARFVGARRVHNLATGLVTETITVISGNEYQVTIAGGSGDTAVASGAFTGTLTANGTNRISWNSGTPKTAGSTSLTLTVTGTLTQMLVEDVTGQANQNPSENVEIGAEHGTNVGNVKYFNYENGNTVSAGGVVTEAQGTAIAAATLKGVLVEEARTNGIADSEDFSAWTLTGGMVVTTNTQVAPSGQQTADNLNDPGASFSSVDSSSVAIINNAKVSASIYVKKDAIPAATRFGLYRIEMSGGTLIRIDLTFDTSTGEVFANVLSGSGTILSFGSELISTPGGDYYKFSLVGVNDATGNNSARTQFFPAVGSGLISGPISAAVTGSMDVWGAQLEVGSFISSYIPTSGAAATRNVEALSYPNTNILDAEGTLALSFTPNGSTAQYVARAVDSAIIGVRGTNIDVLYIDDTSGEVALADGTSVTTITAMPSLVAGTSVKLAGRWSAISSLMKINQDGTENEAAFDGSMNKSAAMTIGYSGANRANGTYKNISLYDGAVDDPTFTGLTT